MVLLVCCYLYHKRSNTINVNAEAKEQGRDMQTLVDDSGIFIEVSRSVQASSESLLAPLARNPFTRCKWVSDVPSGKPLPDAPRRLHYQAFGRNAAGLVPSGTRWRPHHKRGWCGLARLQAPPSTNAMHASTSDEEVCKPH